jgi:hypothetical protein
VAECIGLNDCLEIEEKLNFMCVEIVLKEKSAEVEGKSEEILHVVGNEVVTDIGSV